MLCLGILGMSLIFFVLSIVYLIRKNGQNWQNFNLPIVFWLSTFVILTSSFTLWKANQAFKSEKFLQFRLMTGLTLFLAISFVFLQILGWVKLQSQGIFLNGSVSGSFVYIISGLHLLHLAGGVIFLSLTFIEAIRHTSYIDSFIYSVNPPNQLRLKLITIYWHFVDILWLYLFVFFFLNNLFS